MGTGVLGIQRILQFDLAIQGQTVGIVDALGTLGCHGSGLTGGNLAEVAGGHAGAAVVKAAVTLTAGAAIAVVTLSLIHI